jgi:hypothetical protein
MGSSSPWHRFQNYFLRYDDLDFSIDISRMKFSDEFFDKMQPRVWQIVSHVRVAAGDEPADDKFSLAK